MSYVDKSDRMTNHYTVRCQTRKWNKKLFYSFTSPDYSQQFPPFNMLRWKTNSQRLLRAVIEKGNRTQPTGRHTLVMTNMSWLDTDLSDHCPTPLQRLNCRVFSVQGKIKNAYKWGLKNVL